MVAMSLSVIVARSRRRAPAQITMPVLENVQSFGEHEFKQVEVALIGQTKIANAPTFGEHELKLVEHVAIAHTKFANSQTFGEHSLEPTGGVVAIEHTAFANEQTFGEHELIQTDAKPTSGLLLMDGFEPYNPGATAGNIADRWSQSGSGVEWLPSGGINGKGAVRRTSTSINNFKSALFAGGDGVPVGTEFHFAAWMCFPDGVPSGGSDRMLIGYEVGDSSDAYIRIGPNARLQLTFLRSSSFFLSDYVTVAEEGNGAGIGYLADKAGKWVHIEGVIKLDGVDGMCKIWLDGELVLDFEGDLSAVEEGAITRLALLSGGGTPNKCDWDDVICWTSGTEEFSWDQIGALAVGGFKGHRIETYYPEANGSINQLESWDEEYENWENVADNPFRDDNDTYNRTSTPGHVDLYVFGDLSDETELDEILGVQVVAVDSRQSSISATRKIRALIGSDHRDSPDMSVPSLYGDSYVKQAWARNPVDLSPWTIESLNNTEFGVMLTSIDLGNYRVTQMFVEVLRAGGLNEIIEDPPLVPSAHVDLKIEANTVTEALVDFPTMIDMSLLPQDFKDTIQDGAGNLRATLLDDTLLHLDVIWWDAYEQEGFAFVKLPNIHPDADTEFRLRTYTTGNQPKPDADGGRNGVWSDYEVVLFFDDGDGWTDHSGKKVMINNALNVNRRTYLPVDSPLFAGRALRLHDPSNEATGFSISTLLSQSLEEVTFGMSLMTTRQHTSNNYSAGSLYNSANTSQYAMQGWRGSDSSGNDAIQMWDANNSWLNTTPRFIPENDVERFRSWIQYSASTGGTRRHVINGPDGYVASAAFSNRPTLNAVNIGRSRPNDTSEPGNFEYGFVYVRPEYLNDHWLRAEYNMLSDPGSFVTYPGDEEVIIGGLQNWNPDTSHFALNRPMLLNGRVKAGPGTSEGTLSWQSARAYQSIAGKKYWEIVVLKGGGLAIGLGDQYIANYVRLGDWLYFHRVWRASFVHGGLWETGKFYHGSLDPNGVDVGFTVNEGDIVMCAFDNDTGRFHVGKNGVWYGNPETGEGAVHTFPGTAIIQNFMYTPLYYPMVSVFDAELRGRFQEDVQVYPAPAGFEAFE